MSFHGIPLASAVLIRHNSKGAFAIHDGGKLSHSATWRLDYNGREGQYEEKGGCERQLTRDDARLMERLDYVGREGRFEGKGAGSQVDCTYWTQDGPISRGDLERELASAQGAFVDSIVTVKREYAARLGLDSKEAFQQLMRSTWNEAASHWEMGDEESSTWRKMFDDPSEVRWFACYHTDAAESLHVHVTTWSSRGTISTGQQISAKSTRIAKQVVYRDAYHRVRNSRSIEQTLARDLAVARAREEVGGRNNERQLTAIERRAGEIGIEAPSVARTSDARGRERIESRLERVRERFETGEGRISKDWELQSRARKVADVLYESSPGYREAYDAYRERVEDKADMAALSVGEPQGEDGEYTKDQLVTKHERDRFVRKEMDDLKQRVASAIIRSADPEAPMRERVQAESRGIRRSAVFDAMRLENNPLGLSREQAGALIEIARQPNRQNAANDFAAIVVASPEMQRRIDAAVDRIAANPQLSERPREEIRDAVERRVVEGVAAEFAWRADAGRLDPDRQVTYDVSRRVTRIEERPVVSLARQNQGTGLGMSLPQHQQFQAAFDRAVAAAQRDDETAVRDASRDAARIIIASPEVARILDDASERVARETNGDRSDVRDRAERMAVTTIASQVERSATREAERKDDREQRNRTARARQIDPSMSLGRLAGSITTGLSREAVEGLAHGRRKKRGDQEEERQRNRNAR